jgi:hypothetical protein
MGAMDLSAWLGSPPIAPKDRQNAKFPDSALSASDSSQEHSPLDEIQPADADEGDIDHPQTEPGERDDPGLDLEEDSLSGRASRLHIGFIIDVPPIQNKSDYEYLPGHFVVDRVLSEYPGHQYLVKLASGEIELV